MNNRLYNISQRGSAEYMSNYVVIDLEMCRTGNNYTGEEVGLPNETIQIGAVRLDENLEIAGQFMTYVSPQYGYISDFIHRMTGISGRDIQNAPQMKEALEHFMSWLPSPDIEMISWSYTDRAQIEREMEVKCIRLDGMEELMRGWIDCQEEFSRKLKNRKRFNLTDALVIADIPYVGEAHDGLTDAYNTALLFKKLRLDPDFRINEYYRKSLEPKSPALTFSLGDMLSGMGVAADSAQSCSADRN